ncbi:FAST kinase domain-containing protein 5, mitochondrial [Diorhabda sublineata]|uniref:FAST kinase domain-containing protein 5, mitochondrial n=1 Tax=Diorhabda sublineata TaxID=1163346 RepID=UPI0024E10393|nr:FAST kinase domain-containing protein 5, mitochondrial [Diorhabda sublineata]
MLRHIFRYYKPKYIKYFKYKPTLTANILNVNSNLFFYCESNVSLHTSTLYETNREVFVDHENSFAYKILPRDSSDSLVNKLSSKDVTSTEEFNEILDRNWRDSTISDIVNTFIRVKNFCKSNNITVSDTRFDNLVDGLMDNCEHITDDELISLLHCLTEFPFVESYSAHNFHDIWSCLDDLCCWKLVDWDIEKSFTVANIWYQLHLGKLCDYINILIDRCVKKATVLTKDQLVNIYFYLNICRKRPVDFEYEFALEQLINDMNIDEMAVISMGYFKTKTKIKLLPIQEAIINKVMQHAKDIQDISLTAILKILRYSKPFKLVDKVEKMTEKLYPEIDRLSDLACTHLALLSTGVQTYNKMVFQKISEKFINHITDPQKIRFKDIERILNVLTMFNFVPKTDTDIFKACYDEIHKNERIAETVKYPRCLACSLNYLSLRNMYSYELTDKIMDLEYIISVYGKGAKAIPREIFSLDRCIDIDCPDYTGNRLSPDLKYKAAKWLTEFTPSYDQWKKLSAIDKLILDTIDTVRSIVGDDRFMFIHHILPHFSRADIVVCKNKKTGEFVEPVGFHNYILGDVMYPFNDGSLEWFAVVVLGWNNTIKDTNLCLGHSLMKERQLRKIGYNPVLVIWSEFQGLQSQVQRKQYISNKLMLKQ